MTLAPRLAKLCALAAAVVIHGALAWAVIPRTEVKVEGGAGAQDVRLGTSFADMAAGTLEAVHVDEITEPTPPQDVARAENAPPPLAPAPRPEIIRAGPVTIERVAPVAPDAAPLVAALAPPPNTVAPQRAEPVKPEAAATPIPPETLSAEQDAPPAPTRSLRPERRSAAFEKKHEEALPPKKAPKKKPAAKTARGNAARDATAGSPSGTAKTKAKSPGNATGKAKARGNAAASNYPGLVMRRIARVPRPRSTARGAAVVAFRVDSGGGLARASIARSSGSAQLDRAALRIIRRAAPFPPPPAGAQRSFTINIEGR